MKCLITREFNALLYKSNYSIKCTTDVFFLYTLTLCRIYHDLLSQTEYIVNKNVVIGA